MRLSNSESSNFDPGGNRAPHLWYGDSAPSTERAFVAAPLMSLYWDVAASVLYIKTAHTPAAGDWKPLLAAGVTATGNLTVSGTITAADFVAQ